MFKQTIAAICLLPALCLLMYCGGKPSPFRVIDLADVGLSITYPLADSTFTVNDSASIRITIVNEQYFDSLELYIGDSLCTVITDSVFNSSHWFESRQKLINPYDTTVSIIGYINDGTRRADTIPIHILGYAPQIILNPPAFIEAYIDSACTLSIKTTGTLTVRYEWFKNNALFRPNGSEKLVFTSIIDADTGKYHCIVSNPWGKDTSTTVKIDVRSKNAPQAPANLTIVEKTADSVRLRWNASPGAIAYYLFRDTTYQPGAISIDTVTDTFATVAAGNYSYWVMARNQTFTSFPSNLIYAGSLNKKPAWARRTFEIILHEGQDSILNFSALFSDPNGLGDTLSCAFVDTFALASIDSGSLKISAGRMSAGTYLREAVVFDGKLGDTTTFFVTVLATTCTLTIQPLQNGLISIAGNRTTYRYGDTATLTAVAATGYKFDSWINHLENRTLPTIKIVMNGNTTIGASFVLISVAECQSIFPGESINQKIKTIATSAQHAGTICPVPGIYESNTLEVTGKLEILIR